MILTKLRVLAIAAGLAAAGAAFATLATQAVAAAAPAPTGTAHALTMAQFNSRFKSTGLVAQPPKNSNVSGSTAVPNTTYQICLNLETSMCWQAEGSGQQIHATTSSNSNWTILAIGSANPVKFQDGNTKCAYMDTASGHAFMLGSNACSSTYNSSSTQAFNLSSFSAPFSMRSDYSGSGGGGNIMVFAVGSDKPVWVNNDSGDINWDNF
jgi:hypothetical protein